jgi:hypothetical protein
MFAGISNRTDPARFSPAGYGRQGAEIHEEPVMASEEQRQEIDNKVGILGELGCRVQSDSRTTEESLLAHSR